MADYDRFISYIYLYERGMKTMNTGFAKVESRSGQCRVNITMKNMYHESHVKFSVYMFVRREKRLLGILLGELQTQNSTGTFDGVTDSENIQGSGYTLDEVCGMIIRGDNGKIYGTGWDDEALDIDRFAPISQAEAGAPGAGTDAPAPGAAVDAQTETLESVSGTDVQTGASEDIETPENIGASEEDPLSGWNAFMDPQLPKKLDSTVPVEELNLRAESMGGAAARLEDMAPEPADRDDAGADAGPAETQKPVFGHEDPVLKMSPLEKIIDGGMRMFPFEDDEITACVRMEPQDIGLLPMPYWRLAGNSFLLHGYYSYRHLIMAQKKDGTYIFGIPGVDDERERFMAKLFGFPQFKPVRVNAAGPGRFGYWCMALEDPASGERSVV